MTGKAAFDQPSANSLPRNVLDNLREGCQVIGFDYRYLYLNDTAAAQGRRPKEQLLGCTMGESYPGIEDTAMFTLLRRCMTDRSAEEMENEFEFPDRSKGWFQLRFEPVPDGVFIMSLDITEKRRTEEQLRMAQRLESVGRLAGGIAHDFNNLLSVIIGYAEFGIESVPQGEPLRADLEEIHKAGKRAAELTRQLLAFSRKQVLQPEVINLNKILSGIENMLRRIIGEDVLLRMRLSDDLGNANVDAGQIEQVVMNLAVNARDAMPQGGHLTIETANIELDEEYCRHHIEVKPGFFVLLSVTDSGSGMDGHTIGRIFEPFFTTKEPGKGTGLGLSTVFGVIKQSGGSIWVYSEPGNGTTFKLYFPRNLSAAESLKLVAEGPTRATAGETILIVEDEDTVRKVAQRILTSAGYTVLTAASGAEALLACDHHKDAIHLVLTDVVMPRMSGRELAQRLTAIRPELKILFMSGYNDDAIVQHGVLAPGAPFVTKPFNVADFTRKVREALDAAAGGVNTDQGE